MRGTPVPELAEQVVRRASREKPADALLREVLKSQHALARADAAKVSQAVFAYFRWYGWLSQSKPLREQLQAAEDLARRFAAKPESFRNAELVEGCVPDWVKGEMEVSPAWVRALQAEPKLWLRAQPGQGRALAKRLDDCRPFGQGLLSDTLQYLGRKDLFRTPEFQAGEFEVQDLSSQVVGLCCSPQPGQTWWDACAGEGGKTLHLSALMRNQGLIWSSDRTEWRLRILKRRAARAKVFNYRVAAWDGSSRLPTKTRFDGVLVDAPCSGIGTWHRNPHARWTTTLQDVVELGEIQKRLLDYAAVAVKTGGKLVYAVCTLARAETVQVTDWFLAHHPEFQPLPGVNPLTNEGPPEPQLLLWPQQFGGNGMFIASWSRS